MKLFVLPTYDKADKADGGIRRVVEAQKHWLPQLGIELVASQQAADVCAYHAMDYQETRKPMVSHCHGMYWREYEWGKFAGHINKCVMTTAVHADVVTVPTEWVARTLRHELWIEPLVIPHGVDLDSWTYSPEPDGYVLWNKARMDIVSNPIALHALGQRLMDVEFVGTFSPANATKNVRSVGALNYTDAKGLVEKCGIYLATTRETFGIGTIEAMACGKPILGWNWGGTAEIVRHMVDGYLAEVGDYDELVEGYHWIQENYMKCSQAVRKSVEAQYQWQDIMRNHYIPLYESVLNA